MQHVAGVESLKGDQWWPWPGNKGPVCTGMGKGITPQSCQHIREHVSIRVSFNGMIPTTLMHLQFSSVQFSRQSCPILCDPMNHSTPGLPVHHQLLEFTQTHVHRASDAQPSHPLLSPSPPAPNASQHQSLFQWVNSSHEVAKVLEFQL